MHAQNIKDFCHHIYGVGPSGSVSGLTLVLVI